MAFSNIFNFYFNPCFFCIDLPFSSPIQLLLHPSFAHFPPQVTSNLLFPSLLLLPRSPLFLISVLISGHIHTSEDLD